MVLNVVYVSFVSLTTMEEDTTAVSSSSIVVRLTKYSCDNSGNIICLEGFHNEASNCTECSLAIGCKLTMSAWTELLWLLFMFKNLMYIV